RGHIIGRAVRRECKCCTNFFRVISRCRNGHGSLLGSTNGNIDRVACMTIRPPYRDEKSRIVCQFPQLQTNLRGELRFQGGGCRGNPVYIPPTNIPWHVYSL